jgi:hypothetical protein
MGDASVKFNTHILQMRSSNSKFPNREEGIVIMMITLTGDFHTPGPAQALMCMHLTSTMPLDRGNWGTKKAKKLTQRQHQEVVGPGFKPRSLGPEA